MAASRFFAVSNFKQKISPKNIARFGENQHIVVFEKLRKIGKHQKKITKPILTLLKV